MATSPSEPSAPGAGDPRVPPEMIAIAVALAAVMSEAQLADGSLAATPDVSRWRWEGWN